MRRTKDQQVKQVVAGLALAVMVNGVESVTSSKMSLEFAFNYAWRRWPQAREFPSIAGHDPGNLFWLGVQKSERRVGGVAAWTSDRWTTPYVTISTWTPHEALIQHAEEGISASDWVELGRLFLERLKPGEVQRS